MKSFSHSLCQFSNLLFPSFGPICHGSFHSSLSFVLFAGGDEKWKKKVQFSFWLAKKIMWRTMDEASIAATNLLTRLMILAIIQRETDKDLTPKNHHKSFKCRQTKKKVFLSRFVFRAPCYIIRLLHFHSRTIFTTQPSELIHNKLYILFLFFRRVQKSSSWPN